MDRNLILMDRNPILMDRNPSEFLAVITELETSALSYMRKDLLVFRCSEIAKCSFKKCC